MDTSSYTPLIEITRGEVVESFHFGAAAIVDVHSNLLAWLGDPYTVTYLRSTAKPFQALPFIEQGGKDAFKLLPSEIAIICASHSGTDEHVNTIKTIQRKTGVLESDLLCGTHPPFHQLTNKAMRQRGEKPTPNRHNCSGKHTGMLAFAIMQGWPKEDYINPSHPVQERILQTFAQICDLPSNKVFLGIDGCSAPNFAVPLYHTALAFARLCDTSDNTSPRGTSCQAIVTAMTSHPEMVAGSERFDTRMMETTGGRVVAKGGAEGYQGLGLLPGTLGTDSPSLGIAIKIFDGDPNRRACLAVTIEVLRQLGGLTSAQMQSLAEFGPNVQINNWRKSIVGQVRPRFKLNRSN